MILPERKSPRMYHRLIARRAYRGAVFAPDYRMAKAWAALMTLTCLRATKLTARVRTLPATRQDPHARYLVLLPVPTTKEEAGATWEATLWLRGAAWASRTPQSEN